MKNRVFSIDNSKAILIFLVVLGHFLEFNINSKTNFILLIIYSFHIPIFVYFSGYLAKYDTTKILKKIVLPYIGIQLFSFVFYNLFEPTNFYLISGYHSLWYMISLTVWYLMIPFFDKCSHPKLLILFSFFVALLVGYDVSAGTIGSISRTIVFFPFFVLGFYSKKFNYFKNINNVRNKIFSLLTILIVITILYIFKDKINIQWFYGSFNYNDLNYTPLIRLVIYIVAMLWLFFFKLFVPNRKLIISKIGENSLSVYLLHYLIVYIIVKTRFLYIGNHPTINSFIITILLTFILSRDFIIKIFKKSDKSDII